MSDFPHGEQRGYSRGCRCEPCRAAHAAYTRRHRARSLPAKQIPHGTYNGYVNYGCRCTPCTEAARLSQRRRSRRRRLGQHSPNCWETTMDDLITWLRACLDDDERVAREALHDDAVRPGEWTTEHHGMGREPNTCHIAEDRSGHYWSVAHDVFIPNAAHMVRWDPARVLAEIDAKRRIIELHDGQVVAWPDDSRHCQTCSSRSDGLAAYPCDTARLLALPYADREGYREEWNADAGSARLSEPSAAQLSPAGGIGCTDASEGESGGSR